jgi:hypothetical protein
MRSRTKSAITWIDALVNRPNNDGTVECEYCDDSDFMGYAEGIHRPLNGPHRVQMGWVSGARLVDASAGGQFTLSPLNASNPLFPQVARIVRPSGDPYYLSYRDTSGYDGFLTSTYYSRVSSARPTSTAGRVVRQTRALSARWVTATRSPMRATASPSCRTATG